MTAGPGPDARRYSRVQLPIEAEVSSMTIGHFRQRANLRDVSAGGAFFYAQMTPAVGTLVKVDFTVSVVGSEVQISCEGPVVRVEKQALGDQSGIAIEFSQLNMGSW